MEIFTIFCIAAISTYLLIWVIFKSPIVILFKDKPGNRKVHQRIIPRIGGIAIVIGFQIILYFWEELLPSQPQLPPQIKNLFMFASLAIIPVGLADDVVIIGIKSGLKLVLEILIALIIVLFFDIRLDQVHFLEWNFTLGWIGIPVSIIWIVGVTNAINIIDGVDGLAGSIMIVIFATIASLTGFSGDGAVFVLCVILAGLITGFLFHNISPARVFLGDTGSLFLGLIAGLLSIYLVSEKQKTYPVVIAPLMLGLPVLDVAVAMWRRFTYRLFSGDSILNAIKAMAIADNEHTHHRLIHRGLTHTQTVLIMTMFHINICISAVLVCLTVINISLLLLCYVAVLTIWFLYRLHYFDNVSLFLKRQNIFVLLKKENVAVICYDDVLQYSLKKYKQNKFTFVFKTVEEILISSKKYCSVIIEQKPGVPIENSIMLASTIFMQSACPVVVICSGNESIPMYFEEHKFKQKSFLIIKKPIYIPSFLKEISTLINQSRGWGMERLAIDTRKFFLQAEIHEKI